MKQKLKDALIAALARCQASGALPAGECPEFVIERPKQGSHGDLAANLAMQLARTLRMKPRDIADALVEELGQAGGLLTKAEIAGPGFMNFFIQPAAWLSILPEILAKGADYGRGGFGSGRRVNVEFVSANPTGPLHVGHGRGAALGDTLARLLAFSGYEVSAEYYINDAGNQMATLGRSLLVRARQEEGSDEPFPDNHYRGEYMVDLAREYLATDQGKAALAMPQDQAVPLASQWAGDKILAGIKDDLAAFGVKHEIWFSERSLVEKGAVEAALAELEKRGHLYQADGALWFRATDFGDEKDRVVRRQNGELTYFAKRHRLSPGQVPARL